MAFDTVSQILLILFKNEATKIDNELDNARPVTVPKQYPQDLN
jgi:hypothetical protein